MGAVHRGRDVDLGRDLALKVLLERHRDRPDLVGRFVEEAQICGQLQHPGDGAGLRAGHAGRQPAVLRHEAGQRADARRPPCRSASPATDLPRFLSIFEAICQTMAYAHSRGVIHRDLKPANVMVGSFGEVQVMDWGLAKVLPKDGRRRPSLEPPVNETVVATSRSSGDSDLSQAGSVLGTPAYMAPEQARGETEAVDRRADVFALGSILCEILTGKPAFVGDSMRSRFSDLRAGRTRPRPGRGWSHCGADHELLDPGPRLPGCRARRTGRPTRAWSPDADRLPGRRAGAAARGRAVPGRRERPRRGGRGQGVGRAAGAAADWRALAATVAPGRRAGWRRLAVGRAPAAGAGPGSGRAGQPRAPEATRLRGLAQGAPVGDLGPWEVAAVAAEKARDLLETGDRAGAPQTGRETGGRDGGRAAAGRGRGAGGRARPDPPRPARRHPQRRGRRPGRLEHRRGLRRRLPRGRARRGRHARRRGGQEDPVPAARGGDGPGDRAGRLGRHPPRPKEGPCRRGDAVGPGRRRRPRPLAARPAPGPRPAREGRSPGGAPNAGQGRERSRRWGRSASTSWAGR